MLLANRLGTIRCVHVSVLILWLLHHFSYSIHCSKIRGPLKNATSVYFHILTTLRQLKPVLGSPSFLGLVLSRASATNPLANILKNVLLWGEDDSNIYFLHNLQANCLCSISPVSGLYPEVNQPCTPPNERLGFTGPYLIK